MENEAIICKAASDPTLAVGDYVMDTGRPRKVVHISNFPNGGRGIVVEPVIYPKEQLQREQAAACHKAIMEYITRVRAGEIKPTEAGEAYLFKHLPDKYLGNGRFVGVDDQEGGKAHEGSDDPARAGEEGL